MYCFNCGKNISTTSKFCRFCGVTVRGGESHKVSLPEQKTRKFSYAQPIWHLVILSIITFAVYEIYWFYRNWKHLKEYKHLDISPGWRTVGVFVPILNIFLVYNQFKNIRDISKEVGIVTYSSPGWLAIGYFVLSGISLRLTVKTWNWTDPASVLGITLIALFIDLLAIWILVIVQKTLNRYWTSEQPVLKIRSKLSGKEITALVVGGILWILALVGTLFPEG